MAAHPPCPESSDICGGRCYGAQRLSFSPASRFPKAIRTRSATRSRTRSSTPSSPTTSSSASPTTAIPTPGWAARRWSPPTRSSSPAKAARPTPYMKKYGKHTIVNREALTEIARGVVSDIGYDQDGFSLPRRRRRGAAARPVARHRHGRQCQEQGRQSRRAGGRGRPGPDVRLRLPRLRGVREELLHAGADLFLAQDTGRC